MTAVLEKEDEWGPIAAAPRVWNKRILAHDGHEVFIAVYGTLPGYSGGLWVRERCEVPANVTHWMELPRPPKE